MDEDRDLFHAIMMNCKLLVLDGDGSPTRATTSCSVMAGFATLNPDTTRHIMSFAFGKTDIVNLEGFPYYVGETRGQGDLRKLGKEKILQVALDVNVLRADGNDWWGVIVDDNGDKVTIVDAIERGLVTEDNADEVWGPHLERRLGSWKRVGSGGKKNGTVVGEIEVTRVTQAEVAQMNKDNPWPDY